VVLVHGSALELARLFGRGDEGVSRPRPVLLCDDRAEAMTHAYAALKIFAQRADWHAHDLLMCAPPDSPQARLVADRLAHCADLFLGGLQHDWVQVDPAEPPTAVPSRRLVSMVERLLSAAAVFAPGETERDNLRVALPSPRQQSMI